MKFKTKFLIILLIATFAILLIGETTVKSTDDKDLKFCIFTINDANGNNSFDMGQGDAEYQELGCEIENIKSGYYFKLNIQINLGQYIELNGLGGFRLNRTYYNEYEPTDTDKYYEYITDIKSIADISKIKDRQEYTFKDVETNFTQNFTLDLFFLGDLTPIYNEKQELNNKLSSLNLQRNENGYEIIKYFELEDINGIENFDLVSYSTEILNKAINDNSITLEFVGGMGGPTPFCYLHPLSYFVYKNGIYYGPKSLGYGGPRQMITVPNNIENIEDYSISRLNAYIENYNKEFDDTVEFLRLKKVSGDNYKVYWKYKGSNNEFENDIVIKKDTSSNYINYWYNNFKKNNKRINTLLSK